MIGIGIMILFMVIYTVVSIGLFCYALITFITKSSPWERFDRISTSTVISLLASTILIGLFHGNIFSTFFLEFIIFLSVLSSSSIGYLVKDKNIISKNNDVELIYQAMRFVIGAALGFLSLCVVFIVMFFILCLFIDLD